MEDLKMSAWYALLCWMFTCLLGHAEAGKLTLVGPRTRVVLAGHDIRLNFTVTVPRNTTLGLLECFRNNTRVTRAYILESDPYSDQKKNIQVVLHFNGSSESGKYYCSYKHARVDLAIVALHEGFKRRYDAIIAPVTTVTVLLLIFSTVGSCYIYKSQATHEGRRDSGRSATQSRTSQKGDDGGQEGTSEEATAADNSVYTALESRPTSIYDVLDASASGSSSRKQSKKKTSKRSKKKDEVASAGDGIFESVYENL